MRLGLFVTCLTDTLYPEVGKAVVRLLERLGHPVEFPAGQTCCGQMHLNTGYGDRALPLIRRHVEVFEDLDALVAPSASCVASVRHQHPRAAAAAGDDELARRSQLLGEKTWELADFLVNVLQVEDVGATYDADVTYHPTCHSLRTLRTVEPTERLLRQVRGLRLHPLRDAEECCGFGGTFAMKNAAVSEAMLADKLAAVAASGARVCATSDASCLMHLAGGAARRSPAVRVVHLAEILVSTS